MPSLGQARKGFQRRASVHLPHDDLVRADGDILLDDLVDVFHGGVLARRRRQKRSQVGRVTRQQDEDEDAPPQPHALVGPRDAVRLHGVHAAAHDVERVSHHAVERRPACHL